MAHDEDTSETLLISRSVRNSQLVLDLFERFALRLRDTPKDEGESNQTNSSIQPERARRADGSINERERIGQDE